MFYVLAIVIALYLFLFTDIKLDNLSVSQKALIFALVVCAYAGYKKFDVYSLYDSPEHLANLGNIASVSQSKHGLVRSNITTIGWFPPIVGNGTVTTSSSANGTSIRNGSVMKYYTIDKKPASGVSLRPSTTYINPPGEKTRFSGIVVDIYNNVCFDNIQFDSSGGPNIKSLLNGVILVDTNFEIKNSVIRRNGYGAMPTFFIYPLLGMTLKCKKLIVGSKQQDTMFLNPSVIYKLHYDQNSSFNSSNDKYYTLSKL